MLIFYKHRYFAANKSVMTQSIQFIFVFILIYIQLF